MKVTWWYDGLHDQMNLRVNGCLETKVTFHEMVDCSSASYSYDFAMFDLVMSKLQPLVFLSMPVHDERG